MVLQFARFWTSNELTGSYSGSLACSLTKCLWGIAISTASQNVTMYIGLKAAGWSFCGPRASETISPDSVFDASLGPEVGSLGRMAHRKMLAGRGIMGANNNSPASAEGNWLRLGRGRHRRWFWRLGRGSRCFSWVRLVVET